MDAGRMPTRRAVRIPVWILLITLVGCNTAYLGIQVEDASNETRSAVLITGVNLASGATSAGLEPNDIIISFNLQGVTTVNKLQQDLAAIPLNDTVTFKVFRPSTDSVIEADVKLAADPNNVPTSLGVNIKTSDIPTGVEVVSVEDNSAADLAGLLPGDVINKFGTSAIANVEQFRRALAPVIDGSTVTVTFRRNLLVTDNTTDVTIRFDVVSRIPVPGITVQDLSPQLAETMGYPALGGVRVDASLIDGTGFDAGIMPRDVIFQYGTTQITQVSDLVSAVRQFGPTGTVKVGLARGGDIESIDVPLRGPQYGQNYTLDVGLSMQQTSGGLLVLAVAVGSFAEQAGLRVNDIITAVSGSATLTPQDFYRDIDAALDIRPTIQGVTLSTLRDNVSVSRFLPIRTSTPTTNSSSGTTKRIPGET